MNYLKIGDRIKTFRTSQKITQKQLAESTGLAEITIRQYENGSREPNRKNVEKISNALNIPINFFYWDRFKEGEEKELLSVLDSTLDRLNIKNDDGMQNLRKKVSSDYSNELLEIFNKLTNIGKQEAIHQVKLITKIPEYKKE